MAVRNANPHTISAWRGLNTFASRNNVDEQSWIDANNVLVNARGEAEVLRSPKAFGTTLALSDADPILDLESDPCSDEAQPIVSMDEFQRVAGNALLIDRGEESLYLLAAGGAPTIVKVGNSGAAWTSLSINDTMQRSDGVEFVQIMNNLSSVYRNGITAPVAAPMIAYAANARDTTVIAVSLQGSYAYMNSTTGHVSSPSPLSNILGVSAAGFDVTFSVQASTQLGVDKIVFFLTVDGGNIPYLVIDCITGDPKTAVNANATVTLVQSDLLRDTLTPETLYNDPPPTNATSMFAYKDRIFLIVNGGMQYSGFESCYMGNSYESWPVLNQLNVPGQNDVAVGGIGTQSGALIFGQKDCYLMTGFPSDKVSSPNNAIAVTEHLEPLKWNIGITYPKTAVSTPFGVIWTDNTRRIRNWTANGFPAEIGLSLRKELDTMTGTLSARWFQHGKNGGYYILTDGATTLFLMLYVSPENGQIQTGFGKSTTFAPNAISGATFANVEHFYYSANDQVYEILNPDAAGDGWAAGTNIFFKILIGNSLNFSALSSMRISGGLNGLTVTQAPASKRVDAVTGAYADEIDPEDVVLGDDLEADTGGVMYGMIDSPERAAHTMNFVFDIDDSEYRNVDSFTVNVQNKRRVI